HTLSRLELGHFVEEEKRVTMRNDRLDHVASEGRGQGGRAALHGPESTALTSRNRFASRLLRCANRHTSIPDTSQFPRYPHHQGARGRRPLGEELCGGFAVPASPAEQ